jgi:TRAP-type C4-dicarboxylate transport system substrate-binding protein
MKRIILAALILVVSVFAWQMLSVIKIKTIGNPILTGPLVTEIEQPFFLSLQKNTGLPIEVDLKTIDMVGVRDSYQLPMLKDGVFDLVSLRFMQNISNEITLNGLDVIGLNIDHEKAHELANAYAPVVDKRLQEKYNAKLLGLWSFGPQELFCSKPIHKLSDIKGMKVRVQNEHMGQFVRSLGATPAVISFEETRSALENHLIDCAVSSAVSANSAGWLDYVQYYAPITFSSGVNGYVISLSKWNLLNQKQQETLQKAFDKHSNNMWEYSRIVAAEQHNCMLGKDSCKAKKYQFTQYELSKEDKAFINRQVKNTSLKNWFELCNKEYPQCENEWLKVAGPITGIE